MALVTRSIGILLTGAIINRSQQDPENFKFLVHNVGYIISNRIVNVHADASMVKGELDPTPQVEGPVHQQVQEKHKEIMLISFSYFCKL